MSETELLEKLVTTIQKMDDRLVKMEEYLDSNQDGEYDSTDSLAILNEALGVSQSNFKDMMATLQENNNKQIESMQINFNKMMENTQKKGMWQLGVFIVGCLATFLFSGSTIL